MAIPQAEEIGQQNDDIQKLALAQSYFNLSESAAWKDLMERIQGLVDAAEQDNFSSRETEPLKIVEEKLRWQQRKLTKRAIEEIVQSQLNTRAAIIEEMNEQRDNEHTDPDA